MNAYQIKELKIFMAKLLATDTFDDFLLEEATITTYNTFVIDGRLVKEFFTGDVNDTILPEQEFSDWKDMKGLCFDLIKGKRTPVNFKIILHLKPALIKEILQKGDSSLSLSDVKAFVLNLKYDGSKLTCITGTAFHNFVLDKTPDRLWDEYISRFLTEKGISFDY
ncbi:MAG: hypothetical protein IJ409_07310 [Lachnospiraceae bacterium]|nr:hypothetical protein [Lachnospiraceae bacterium]MBQ8597576.1 hypothetical protein [Lachnospiraceae bacterium]